MFALCGAYRNYRRGGLLLSPIKRHTEYKRRDLGSNNMAAEKITVYLKGNQSTEVQKRAVYLRDVVSMECTDKVALTHLKCKQIWRVPEGKHHRCVISILQIVEWIHQEYPNAEVQNLGATDLIITFEEQRQLGKVLYALKVFCVALIVFVGAAYSIMSFHIDVDMKRLFEEIYLAVIGQPEKGATILEFSYSVGLALGILFFFNHFGKRRFTKDPTPLEVEMRTYENDIQTTIVETYARKGKEVDVD